MRGDLINKLKAVKDSKMWLDTVAKIKKNNEEHRDWLIIWHDKKEEELCFYTKWDLIRKENEIIRMLKEELKCIKDKEVKDLLEEDLNKSLTWREQILCWETNELQLDICIEWAEYTIEDLWRKEIRWEKCFENLIDKNINILEKEEEQEIEVEESSIQEQLDAMSNMDI